MRDVASVPTSRREIGAVAYDQADHSTRTAFTFQIRSQYSRIDRSEEKYPVRATFKIDIVVHRFGGSYIWKFDRNAYVTAG